MIEIRPFYPLEAAPAEWAAVHAYRRLRMGEDWPGEPILDDAEYEREAKEIWPLYEDRRWYAWEGGEIAGLLGASFRREGTEDYLMHARYVWGWGGVRRARRRQGVATRLMKPLVAFMRERDKTIAGFDASQPDGNAFLAAIGATAKLRQIENRASFAALDWAMIARWRGAAIPPGAPLRWEIHAGRAPRERIEALLPKLARLQADVPLGELDSPPVRTELPAWLAWYEELDRHGGEDLLVMLLEGDEIAAFCETAYDARFPDRVHQMLTAVARPWRGRGLAKGVKAAMMQLIRARHPGIRFISTSNASHNAPMLAINAKLGFEEHRRNDIYQIGVERLAEYLSRRQ